MVCGISDAVAGPDIAVFPEGAVILLRSATLVSSDGAVLRQDGVEVVLGGEVQTLVADIPDFEGGVTGEFLLDHEVPLPAIRDLVVDALGCDRTRPEDGARRRSGVKEAIVALGAIRARTIVGGSERYRKGVVETDLQADAFALVELTDTSANGSLAVSERIPADAQSRRNQMVVVGN